MVQGDPPTCVGVLFEQWKLHHPKRLPALGHKTQIMSQSNPETPQGIVDDAGTVSTEKKKVSLFCA